MFPFLKGVFVGSILAAVVAALLGHAGATGGMLDVRFVELKGYGIWWSWGLFVIGTGLSWGIFQLME